MTQFESNDFDPNAEQLFIDPPGWPKVIGIMSIIFGAISVCCGGLGLIATPFLGPIMEGQLNGAPPSPDMTPDLITIGIGVLSLLLNVVLVIAGIVLISRKASGRKLHLLYSLLFVPIVVATSWNALRVQAAKEVWAHDYPDNPIAQGVQKQIDMGIPIAEITAIVILLIALAWPLICIVWFGFVKTKHSHMTGQPDEEHDPVAV